MHQQLTILITRPLQEAHTLSNLLQQHGFTTVIYPTLEIQPTLSTTQLEQQLASLEHYQFIIFNSLNAVRLINPVFSQVYRNLASPPPIYAIGKTTAQSLIDLEYPNVIYPTHEFSSVGLLHLFSTMPSIDNQHGLLVTGEGGLSAQLVENLSTLGIAVTVLPCYKRVCPKVLNPNVWIEWARQGVTHIVVTSQDALRHLWQMQQSVAGTDFIRQCHIVTFSLRIAHYAETLQIPKDNISITNEASNQGILEFFRNFYVENECSE